MEGLEKLRAERIGVSLDLALWHCIELLAESDKKVINPFGDFCRRELLGEHIEDEEVDWDRIVWCKGSGR